MSTRRPSWPWASMKLSPPQPALLGTVDVPSNEESTVSFKERTDRPGPAMAVAETMTALVLASEKHAEVRGDSVAEFVRNRDATLRLPWARSSAARAAA